MTADRLAVLLGILTSLGFGYIPGLRAWYDTLAADRKAAVMGICLVLIAAAVAGLSCSGVVVTVSCDKSGLLALFDALISALLANQATYLIAVRPVKRLL